MGVIIPTLLWSQSFENILIDQARSNNGPEEPTISISITDPQIIMAGANKDNTYLSKDGGRSWVKKQMKSKYGVYGDPCIISTITGKFMYFHLSLPKGEAFVDEPFLDRIVCQYSTKNVNTFHKGVGIGHNPPKDQDKEWAVYDLKTKRTYVSWTQFDAYGSTNIEDKSVILAAYSDNEGKTWSEPVTMSLITGDCLDDDSTVEGAVPAIGINGEMHVAWANKEKIYFNTYIPGREIGEEKEIAQQIGGWTQDIEGLPRANGLPITVSDMSDGAHKGNIYVCWSDQRNGATDTDVFIISSKDGGRTWNKPKKVNNDTTHTQQFLPWLTIDQTTGFLYTVFYDRRNYSDNQTDVYLAVSKDGGATFENHKISDSPFTPISSVFFGDYINVSAHKNQVRPIWTRYENGKLSIWTALIKGDI